jgi:polyferredoxin
MHRKFCSAKITDGMHFVLVLYYLMYLIYAPNLGTVTKIFHIQVLGLKYSWCFVFAVVNFFFCTFAESDKV